MDGEKEEQKSSKEEEYCLLSEEPQETWLTTNMHHHHHHHHHQQHYNSSFHFVTSISISLDTGAGDLASAPLWSALAELTTLRHLTLLEDETSQWTADGGSSQAARLLSVSA